MCCTPIRAKHSATIDPTLPTPTTPNFNLASFCCDDSPQAETVRLNSTRNLGGGSRSSANVTSNPSSPIIRTDSHQRLSYVLGAVFIQKRALHAPSVPSVRPTSGMPVVALEVIAWRRSVAISSELMSCHPGTGWL